MKIDTITDTSLIMSVVDNKLVSKEQYQLSIYGTAKVYEYIEGIDELVNQDLSITIPVSNNILMNR